VAESLSSEERNWAMASHLSALAGYVFPFGNLLGPLIVWLVKRESSAFVDEQGKESLNFEISVTIAAVISFVLLFVVIGIFLLIALVVFQLIIVIMAAVKTSNGEHFRYPLLPDALRLIK
jgi:uncharacterized Tic20 family protein